MCGLGLTKGVGLMLQGLNIKLLEHGHESHQLKGGDK